MQRTRKPLTLDAPAQERFDSCLRLAYKIIHRFVRIYGLDFDDAESVGLEYLARAARCFDPARGSKFSTYSGKSVRRGLETQLGRQRRRQSRLRTVSFSVLTHKADSEDRLGFDPPDTRTPSAPQQVEEREHQANVRQALEHISAALQPWERYLWDTLVSYCVQGKTMREVALQDGISFQAVRGRIRRGIQLIRQCWPGLVVGAPVCCGEQSASVPSPVEPACSADASKDALRPAPIEEKPAAQCSLPGLDVKKEEPRPTAAVPKARSVPISGRVLVRVLAGYIECTIRCAQRGLSAPEIAAAVKEGLPEVAAALVLLAWEKRVIRSGQFFDVAKSPSGQSYAPLDRLADEYKALSFPRDSAFFHKRRPFAWPTTRARMMRPSGVAQRAAVPCRLEGGPTAVFVVPLSPARPVSVKTILNPKGQSLCTNWIESATR